MGIKILIIEACLISGDDIATPAAINDEVEVGKDDALSLARAGRARYVARDDDPTKGLLTATAEDKTAAKKRAALVRAEADARAAAVAASTPVGQAEAIAAAVAAALKAAGITPAVAAAA